MDSSIPVGGTEELLQTFKNDVGGVPVHSEAVTPTDKDGVPFSTTNRFPVDAPLAAGAATAANQQTNALTDAQLRAAAVPVSGPLTDAQLRAAAVPVSNASLPLPVGAATSANQATEITSLGNLDANLGAKADAAATTDTGTFSVLAFIKRTLQNWTTLLARIPVLLSGRMPVVSEQILDPGNSAYITSGGATFTGAWFATRNKGIQENFTLLTAYTIATGLPISDLTFTLTFQGSDDGVNPTVNVAAAIPAFEANRLLHATDWLSNQWEYYRVIMTPSRALVAGEAIVVATRHSLQAGNKFLYPMNYKSVMDAQVATITRSVLVGFRQDGTAVNTRASSTSDANSSTTNIPTGSGNGFIGSAWIDLETLAGFYVSFLSNQVCTVYIDRSIDGITADETRAFNTVASGHFSKQFTKLARYARVRVDNFGGATTTTFRLQTGVVNVSSNMPTGRLDEALTDASIAQNTHATISAKEPAGAHSNIGKGLLGGLDVGIVEHEVATPIMKHESVSGGASNSVDTNGVQICTSPPSNMQAVLIQSDPDNGNVVIYLSDALSTATNGAAMHALGTAASVVFPVGNGQTFYARTSTGSGKSVRWTFLRRTSPA